MNKQIIIFFIAESKFENNSLYKLKDYLFNGYDRSIRPVLDSKNTIDCDVQFVLSQILEIVGLDLIII